MDYGSNNCMAHDLEVDSRCLKNNNDEPPPSFCFETWCYVDPTRCKTSKHWYYKSDLLPDSGAFYSYSACNSTADPWLDLHSTAALENITLKVLLPAVWYPYHYKETETGEPAGFYGPEYFNDTVPWKGADIDYLNAIKDISNIGAIEYTFVSGAALNWTNGWTAAVRDVQAGLACFALSNFWVTVDRLSMTSFTVPIFQEKMYLFAALSSSADNDQSTVAENAAQVFMPFSWQLWLLLIGTSLFISIVSVILEINTESRRVYWERFDRVDWIEATWRERIRISMKVTFHSIMDNSINAMGHFVEADPRSNMRQKILYLGAAFLVMTSMAAYVANLAAFLTISSTNDADYGFSTMEEAILKGVPLCAPHALADDLQELYPLADIVYTDTFEAMVPVFDEGQCDGLIMAITDVENSELLMDMLCERGIASTGSLVLEKPVGFPVCPELAAGMSHWIFEAESQQISFETFRQSYKPPQQTSCSIRPRKYVKNEPDELAQLKPIDFLVPVCGVIICAIIAMGLQAYASRRKRNNTLRKDSTEKINRPPRVSSRMKGNSLKLGSMMNVRAISDNNADDDDGMMDWEWKQDMLQTMKDIQEDYRDFKKQKQNDIQEDYRNFKNQNQNDYRKETKDCAFGGNQRLIGMDGNVKHVTHGRYGHVIESQQQDHPNVSSP